jgi:uncharacterized protein
MRSPQPLASTTPRRLRDLPWAEIGGHRVPVADGWLPRLLGLALLDRRRAGPGLLIPRCRSVHTFGMRFALDVAFLDRAGSVIARRRAVPPGRVLVEPRAWGALEFPA